MKILRKLAIFIILLPFVIALALPGTALASGSAATSNTSQNYRELHDQFVFGDTYTLHSGDTLVGDLFILGGTVTIEEDSRVEGNVILIGGSLSIQALWRKTWSLSAVRPPLSNQAALQAMLSRIGCSLSGDTGRVAGDIITEDQGYSISRCLMDDFPPSVLPGFPSCGTC